MKRISTISLLAVVFTALTYFNASAQIAGWFFKDKDGDGKYTINTTGDETTRDASLISTQLANTPTLSRGSGMTKTSANVRTFNAIVNLTPANTALTLTEAVDGNAYYEFTLIPATGQVVNIGKIQFRFRRGGTTSPDKVQFKYYVGAIANTPDKNDFVNLGATVTSTNTITDGVNQEITGIDAITALQNVGSTQKIVIRAYWYGSTNNTTSAIAFGKSVNNSGTVAEYGALSVYDTTTLPVNLTSFTAKPSKNTVQLNWATASEQNNSHFEILRSASGQPNEVIGKVNGNGTTTAANNYHFTDYSPLASAYYQLRQVDNNGDAHLSDIAFVNVDLNVATFSASAVNGKFTAGYQSSTIQQANLVIVDLNGKKITEQQIFLTKGNNQISLPFVANKGVYIARLVAQGKKLSQTKFICQ